MEEPEVLGLQILVLGFLALKTGLVISMNQTEPSEIFI